MLLIFLPALLYWESLTTSLREIRANLRAIVLLSTALVAGTAAAVAAVAHALGVPWGPAWVLGGAAAGVVVAWAAGVVVAWAAGVVVAWAAGQVRRRLHDALSENIATLLTPFTAFLLAEAIHASGVLAVVTCGLIMSQTGPRIGRADTRQQTTAFWTLSTYLLNGALFVLVGLEAQSAIRNLTSVALTRGLLLVVVVTAVVIGARFAWLFTTPYLIRALDRRPQQRERRVGARARVVNGTAGFRGAVSLAAALAVPRTVHSGEPFPDRDLIVFVTAGVLVLTLAQAFVLPAVVRWARLPRDGSVAQERHLAETIATEQTLAALDDLAADLGSDRSAVDRLRREYDKRLRVLQADPDDADHEPALRHNEHYTALAVAALRYKRDILFRLRDEQRIDDTVLRQVQARLDLEEMRLG